MEKTGLDVKGFASGFAALDALSVLCY